MEYIIILHLEQKVEFDTIVPEKPLTKITSASSPSWKNTVYEYANCSFQKFHFWIKDVFYFTEKSILSVCAQKAFTSHFYRCKISNTFITGSFLEYFFDMNSQNSTALSK